MGYQPIENYGVIGDLHTVALVGMNGSIDWLCFPRFDSPSIFAAILDDRNDGRFQIAPTVKSVTRKQFYWPDTNVLITRFLSPEGVAEIADYMPIGEPGPWHGQHQIIRRVSLVRGTMPFRMECRPAFNYSRDKHEVRVCPEGVSFDSLDLSLGLATKVPLKADGLGGAVAEFTLHEGETAIFLLQQTPSRSGCGQALSEGEAERLFESTVRYWRRWLSKCAYQGRWREIVHRSALVLKLLTYEQTGAIVAAPTCSLPEHIGGSRNWDYRYTWIRDAAFTLYALMRIGFTQEAARFIDWLEARCHELDPDGSLQVMYGIDGRHDLTETTLDHLEGYRNSRPVRIGNGAHHQLQLDIYGALMDSVYLYNKYGTPISYGLWKELGRLINWVCDNWRREDRGIWEVRGEPQHFVYSKLMGWVALDRGLRLAEKRSFPADRERWLKARDTIYEEIMNKGWSDKAQAFVQYYGGETLDASNLLMPLVFFVSPTDPRMLKTLDAINRSPAKGGLVSNSLVYRYHAKAGVDGLEGDEGTFNMCTFWLVEALTRAGRTDRRKLDEARLMFERMLGYANHLGLYAEETGPCGEALGNFPQALTHLAL
ncbi:MAG: glycoside hydrolase family 15 protein, partial [Candidatus Tectomicrobia bacterium]|nr:glycoside hydrolase family 15 protein [Candidatus Tectomicrobia bacterium]